MSFGALTRFGLAMQDAITAYAYPGVAQTVAKLLPVYSPDAAVDRPITVLTTSAFPGLPGQSIDSFPANALALQFPLVYADMEPLWYCALGFAAKRYGGTVFPEEIVSGAYRHRCEVLPSPRAHLWEFDQGLAFDDDFVFDQWHARRLTIAGTLGDLVAWEWPDAMVQRVTLSAVPGEPINVAATFLPSGLNTSPESNTLVALQALSLPTQPYVFWDHGETRMSDYSASTPLDAGDVINPSGFTLTIETSLAVHPTAQFDSHYDEPRQQGVTSITGTLIFSSLDTVQRILTQRAGTVQMASLVFTGGEIDGTGVLATYELYLPSLVLQGTRPVWHGAGTMSESLAFSCLPPVSPAAGFPATLTRSPLIWQAVTADNTHFLE